MIKLIFSLAKPSANRRQQSGPSSRLNNASSRNIARNHERFMAAVQSSDR